MSTESKNKRSKSTMAVAAVLLLGLLLALAIVRSEKAGPAGEDHAHEEAGHEHEHEQKPQSAQASASAPAPAPAHEEPERLLLGDAQLERHGVALATAGPARLRSSVQLLGEVQLNQDRSVLVTPRLAGLVLAVHAKAGDRVRRGQVLAIISSQALAEQRGALLTAQQRLALARTSHEREQRLWEEKISAEQDYLAARLLLREAEINVESARQRLASLGAAVGGNPQDLTRHEIRAPIDGVITDRKISVGEALKDDAAVFQVADLSTVWVSVSVPVAEVNRLKLGDQGIVRAPGVEGEGTARLSHVGALLGEQSRQASARLLLANPSGWWRPGLPVTVTLSAGEFEVPVAVAVEAVQTLGDGPVVFSRQGQHFEVRSLSLGRSDGRQVEVLKGLSAGERYAARNSYLIKADIGKAGAGHDH